MDQLGAGLLVVGMGAVIAGCGAVVVLGLVIGEAGTEARSGLVGMARAQGMWGQVLGSLEGRAMAKGDCGLRGS